jgi:Domain of unknown function (DUF1998)
VPIVQDNKNAVLLRASGEPLSEAAMATLQHALARGLELVFQLEEGETLTEPVPDRENRRAILSFEATEGGAGVLNRLASDPQALSRMARAALELMHFCDIEPAMAAADPARLTSDPEAHCAKGCYRCLLSYYNQPDHELIDRTAQTALRILLRLASFAQRRKADLELTTQSRKVYLRPGTQVSSELPLAACPKPDWRWCYACRRRPRKRRHARSRQSLLHESFFALLERWEKNQDQQCHDHQH